MNFIDFKRFDFLDVEIGTEFEIVGKMMENRIGAWVIDLLVELARHNFALRNGMIERGLVGEHHALFLAELDSAREKTRFFTFFHIKKQDARVHVVGLRKIVMVEDFAVKVEHAGGFVTLHIGLVKLGGVFSANHVVV